MRRLAALLALALLLAACGGGGFQAWKKPAAHPKWASLAQKLGVYQRIVCPACKAGDWKLGIIRSKKINALNAGRGIFYVTEGLLAQPMELQEAVIAHEAAHEVAGHVESQELASLATTAAFTVLGAFIPGAGYINYLANPLVTRAFSRAQEMEADRISVWLWRRAHGNLQGGRLLKRFLLRPRKKTPGGGGFLDTHPHPRERAAQLDRILAGRLAPEAPPAYTPPQKEEEEVEVEP